MKLDSKPIVFLLSIILVVCFISLFMSHKSGFEENFQEGLMAQNMKTNFDNIFRDMDKLESSCDSNGKCTGSKSLIDNINNNLLLLEKKLNGNVKSVAATIGGNVKIQQTKPTFAPTTKTMMMTKPTISKKPMPTPTKGMMMTKPTISKKPMPTNKD